MDILSKLTVKPLLIACVALLVALIVASSLAYASAAKVDGLKTQLEAKSTALQDANLNVELQRSSAEKWTGVSTKLNEKLKAEREANIRIKETNRLAVESAEQRSRRLAAELRAARNKYDAIAAKNPECVDFLRMPICPALQSAASSSP